MFLVAVIPSYPGHLNGQANIQPKGKIIGNKSANRTYCDAVEFLAQLGLRA